MVNRFMSESEHLTALKEITPYLRFPEALMASKGFKRHKMECGECFSWDLMPVCGPILHPKGYAVALFFNSMGCVFPMHAHREIEVMMPVKGSIHLCINNETEERLFPGDVKVITPDTPHSARFLEDCYYLAITVPRSRDWPNGSEYD